jgi:tetratricopeptide (TPR) repeat protein
VPQAPPEAVPEELKLLYVQARSHIDSGENAAAVTLLEDLLRRCMAAGIKSLAARALLMLSYTSDVNGEYSLSEQRINAALHLVEDLNLDSVNAHCYVSLARVRVQRGQLLDAEAALGQAMMYAKRAGSPAQEANVYVLQGECRWQQGLLEDAFDYYDAAAGLYRGRNNDPALIGVLNDLNNVAFELERDGAAEAALAEAAELQRVSGAAPNVVEALVQAAMQRLVLGDLPAAWELLGQAQHRMIGRSDYHWVMALELGLGRYFAAVGLRGEANAHFAKAKRVAQQKQNRFRLAEIRLEHAGSLIDGDELEHALAVLIDTETAFELMGMQLGLARTHCAWTRYYAATASPEAAELAFQRAQATAGKLAHPGRTLAADLRRAQVALGLAAAAPKAQPAAAHRQS